MKRKRAGQLKLTFAAEAVVSVPKDNEQELVNALAELLLAAVKKGNDNEKGESHEREDHA